MRADMADAMARIVPEDKGGRGSSLYRHSAEGSDDMPVRNFTMRLIYIYIYIYILYFKSFL